MLLVVAGMAQLETAIFFMVCSNKVVFGRDNIFFFVPKEVFLK